MCDIDNYFFMLEEVPGYFYYERFLRCENKEVSPFHEQGGILEHRHIHVRPPVFRHCSWPERY